MLSNTYNSLYNKVYYDNRDFPVSLIEEHSIEGEVNDTNRKIKLGERVHSFDSLIMYKMFKSSSSLDIKLSNFDNLAIYNSQIDITMIYNYYDSTNDLYNFTVYLYRSDTLESQSNDYNIYGNLGSSSSISFDTIQGNFTFIIENFYSNSKVIFSIMGYESSILVIDSFNSFVKTGSVNNLYFNIPSNSIYINELTEPFVDGDFTILVKYLGLGSIITAESMNDIINVIKYFNLLPKFNVVKNNNNDIVLYIQGEYYYLNNYIEKFDDATLQIEDSVLLGQQNALLGVLDIPNNVFSVKRVSVGSTYNILISDLTNQINENPDYELPIFIIIFDTNKNIYEYTYVNRSANNIGGSGSGSLNSYNITFSNSLNVSFSLLNSNKPVITIYDNNNKVILADEIEVDGTLVEITFYEAQSGTIAVVN